MVSEVSTLSFIFAKIDAPFDRMIILDVVKMPVSTTLINVMKTFFTLGNITVADK
jgi:hypothetical protein